MYLTPLCTLDKNIGKFSVSGSRENVWRISFEVYQQFRGSI